MTSYRSRWLLPITSPPIAHGEVSVDAGVITYVGPARDSTPPGDIRDLGECALLPGLVNVHTHLELTVMRGYLEGLAFRPWITRLTAARAAVMTPELSRASARAGIAEGLQAGITTYADTGESSAVFDAMLEMGVRGIAYHEVFGPDPARCGDAMDALRVRVERARARETALVHAGVSPHAPYTVSDALFSAVASYAIDESLPLAVHIAESQAEIDLVRDARGHFADALRERGIPVAARANSPIELLERTGVLEARPLLVHCVQATDEDAGRAASHECAIAHCPASNAKLGHGIAPLAEWLARGIRVGLGTDSVASSNRMDLLDEARLAVLMQRARLRSFGAIPAARVLELATLGGARALGLEARIGSLATGKDADLAAFPLDGAADSPVFDPADALVFAAGGRRAVLTMVRGRELVHDERLAEDIGDDLLLVRTAASRMAAVARD